MLRIVINRGLQAVVGLVFLSILVFGTSRFIGSPVDLLIGPGTTQEEYRALVRTLGLDRPLPVQYAVFVADLLHGNLGTSFRSDEPVAAMLWQRLQASLELAGTSMMLTLVVGILLGILAARFRNSWTDRSINLANVIGQSLPQFLVGIMLIEVFGVVLGWLPAGGNKGIAALVLPVFTLSLFGVAGIARLLRASMLEVLGSDYLKVARAKGLNELSVIWKHALRNAILPVVGFSGLYFINILMLSMVVEVVFSWPGLGQLTYSAILNRDYPVIQGVVLLAGALMIIVNLAVDIVYTIIDPRLRVSA